MCGVQLLIFFLNYLYSKIIAVFSLFTLRLLQFNVQDFKASACRARRGLIRGGYRRDLRLKRSGMSLVSLRGVNHGVWSHLGCSGHYGAIFCRQSIL